MCSNPELCLRPHLQLCIPLRPNSVLKPVTRFTLVAIRVIQLLSPNSSFVSQGRTPELLSSGCSGHLGVRTHLGLSLRPLCWDLATLAMAEPEHCAPRWGRGGSGWAHSSSAPVGTAFRIRKLSWAQGGGLWRGYQVNSRPTRATE